jgi:hypothetical protein
MNANSAEEIIEEVTESEHPMDRSAIVSMDRLLARIARRPGLWRSRMRTRHRRDEEHLSPLPHAA